MTRRNRESLTPCEIEVLSYGARVFSYTPVARHGTERHCHNTALTPYHGPIALSTPNPSIYP